MLGLERCAILLDQLPYNARLYQLDTKKGWTLDAVYMDSLEFYTKVQSTKNPQRLKPLSHTFDKYKEEQTEIKPTYTKEDYARIFNHKVEELQQFQA